VSANRAALAASPEGAVLLTGAPVVMRLNKDEFRIVFGIEGKSCVHGCSGSVRYRVDWKASDGTARSEQKEVSYVVAPEAARTIAVDRQYLDTAEGALDKMMAQGSPNASLPFLHKEGLALLNTKYDSQGEAKARITSSLITFYRSQYPAVWDTQRTHVEASANTLLKIYLNNVFPAMNVRWGTHPNNIGHTDSAGCFRCHDGSHTSKAGKTITNDCSICHNLVVSNELHPKLLTDLGMK